MVAPEMVQVVGRDGTVIVDGDIVSGGSVVGTNVRIGIDGSVSGADGECWVFVVFDGDGEATGSGITGVIGDS